MKKENATDQNQNANSDILDNIGDRHSHHPELIIPFQISGDKAVDAYRSYYANRPLLPSAFKQPISTEDMQGGFLPYLLYSGDTKLDMTFESQDTRQINGDPKISRQIKEYRVKRVGEGTYYRIPVNASQEVPDSFVRQISPYTLKDMTEITKAKEYSELEQMPDIEPDPEKAESIIRDSIAKSAKESIRHNYSESVKADIDISNSKIECALLPIWVKTIKVGRHEYSFTVNGQTGKAYGAMPVSQPKAMGLFLLSFGGSAGILYTALYLIMQLLGKSGSSTRNLIAILSIFIGFIVSSHVLSSFFRKMRRPSDKRNSVADEKNHDLPLNGKCSLKFSNENEKLLRILTVNQRNVTTKTEEFE